MMVTKRAFWTSVGLVLLSVVATYAATLSTPLGPVVGIGSGNTANACFLLNVSTTDTLASVTITEYQLTACEVGGNPCPTTVKNTVTCTNLPPANFCNLFDNNTATGQPVWCQFTVSSSKDVRASMNVHDKTTGETLAVLPATEK